VTELCLYEGRKKKWENRERKKGNVKVKVKLSP
jgi:hypothetical protein